MSSRGKKRSERVRTLKPAKRKAASATTLDANGWPKGYVKSFSGLSEDFERPPQGELEEREKFD